MLEPQAQQSKRHHHLPISHLLSQYVWVWLWDSVCSDWCTLKHTHCGLLICGDRFVELCDSIWYYRFCNLLKKIIQHNIFCVLLWQFCLDRSPCQQGPQLWEGFLSQCMSTPWWAWASAPPSSQQRPIPSLSPLPAVPLLPYISVPGRIDPSNTRLHRDAVLSCFISFY